MSTANSSIVFLPIEVKARGLEPRTFLGLTFAQQGYQVLIGRKSTLSSLARQQKAPIIWVDKGMDSSENALYHDIKSKGGVILQLHEEGAVMQKGFEEHMMSFENGAYGEDAMKLADLHLMWGQNTYNRVAAKWKQHEDKLRIVGHPKFDLYRRMQKPEQGSGHLLVSTSFVLGNPKNGEAAFLERMKSIIGDETFELFDWDEKARQSKNSRIEITKLVQELATSFPHLKIVVRPHPVENTDYYHSHFSNLDSVSVSTGSKSFREDLKLALAVLHHDCSTGIEATIAGYPVISYSPFTDTEHCQQLAIDASKRVTTADEVKKIITNLIQSDSATLDAFREQREAAISLVKHHIASADQECSSAIVDEVRKISPPSGKATPNKFSLIGRLKRWAIWKFLGDKVQHQKFDHLTSCEIDRIASEFQFSGLTSSLFEKDVCLIQAST